jgi:hypothetical protein
MRKNLLPAFLLICPALLLTAAVPVVAERPEPTVHGTFDGEPMYSVLPPDAIPAINEPAYLEGKAAAAQMKPAEPVIGVVIDGAARAYSTWQLDAHEIVNDRLGGAPIAVTW